MGRSCGAAAAVSGLVVFGTTTSLLSKIGAWCA
jgi:hypothetical protein